MTANNRFAGGSLRCRVVWLLAVFSTLPAVGLKAALAGPPVYTRQTTWAETVRRSPLGEVLGRERTFFNVQDAVAQYLRDEDVKPQPVGER